MTTKPHIYKFNGFWWVSHNGRESFRKGITMNDLHYIFLATILRHKGKRPPV